MSETHLDGERMRFVLSGGRSGTYFLKHYLDRLGPNWNVVHEIRTSHRVFMMLNAAEHGWFPTAPAIASFRRERARRLAALPPGQTHVEVNPFLAPLAPLLPQIVKPCRIVHLIRDPRPWIQSMANFKSLRWKRHFVDHVPFAQSVHRRARGDWSRLPYLVKCAWRWRFANEKILAAAPSSDRFVSLRYEDIFADDEVRWRPALTALFEILGADTVPTARPQGQRPQDNMSLSAAVGPWPEWPADIRRQVADICGPLMTQFDYGGEPGWPT